MASALMGGEWPSRNNSKAKKNRQQQTQLPTGEKRKKIWKVVSLASRKKKNFLERAQGGPAAKK